MNRKIWGWYEMIDTTITIGDDGVVTLPVEVREKYGLCSGGTLRIIELNGVFVLTPITPMVPQLAMEIERLREEAGVTLEDLIRGGQEERERYYQEHYGQAQPA